MTLSSTGYQSLVSRNKDQRLDVDQRIPHKTPKELSNKSAKSKSGRPAGRSRCQQGGGGQQNPNQQPGQQTPKPGQGGQQGGGQTTRIRNKKKPRFGGAFSFDETRRSVY